MIKILLVEDDAHKRTTVAEAILSVPTIAEDMLDISTDVADAKRKLRDKGYDLLILDIHLPRRADKQPEPGGGLEVLRWLKGRGKEHRPTYIIGTTAYDASYELAQTEFNNLIWTIIPFSFSDNAWKERLVATVRLILDQIVPPYANDGVTYRSDVLVVAALEDPELRAVLSLPLSWEEASVRFDASRYFRAKYERDECVFDIVCVAASDKGLSSAAIATTKAIHAFRPRYVVMIGICAGVKGRVELGDIVVADPSWDWGSGKTKLGTDGEEFFHPAQYQMRLDESLRALAIELKAKPDLLKPFADAFSDNKPSNTPQIHVGAFASGAAVLQSRAAVEKILQHHKDLKAVDMEVYSVMYACHIASMPRPQCIAAKAVSDFGDDKKADDYQLYAANMSARFLLEVLRTLLRPKD
ncbi:nucleoside phosphorylase [Bradyrhizobium sp. S3.3.6]|uniref:phosphorylase family protein n=1 Tax=Bradyrhizobium sp. S3.3.6 TaxID=3156429 RepID=UPI00339B8DDA